MAVPTIFLVTTELAFAVAALERPSPPLCVSLEIVPLSWLSVASSYVVSKTAGLPAEQAAATEQEMALAQRNGTVNAPGFVIICSRGTRPMLRRCCRPPDPSAASSAVPGWIIGDVMIDAEEEEWGSGGNKGRRKGQSIYGIRVTLGTYPTLPFNLNRAPVHAACLPSSIF